MLVAPIVLIALYSVDLKTNLLACRRRSRLANWKDFLPPRRPQPVLRPLQDLDDDHADRVGDHGGAAYPLAYFLAFVAGSRRYTLLLVMLAPFFTSYLLRVIAWKVILNDHGVFNSLLWDLGLRPTATASRG